MTATMPESAAQNLNRIQRRIEQINKITDPLKTQMRTALVERDKNQAALRELAPHVVGDVVDHDPAWLDPSVDDRRANYVRAIAARETESRELKAKLDEYEPELVQLREDLAFAGQAVIQEESYSAAAELTALLLATEQARRKWAESQARRVSAYPAHEHIGHRTLKAHAGIPKIDTERLRDLTALLLDEFADWKPDLLPVGNEARARAEHIAEENRKHFNMPRRVVFSSGGDLPQMFEAKISPAPDPQEVAERFRKQREADAAGIKK